MKRFLWLRLAMLGLGGWGCVFADVRLSDVFADHAVLQREIAVPIWGWAQPGETVTVTFAGQTRTTTAGTDGTWRVRLAPLPTSAEPRDLEVRGAKNVVTRHDILVGEVWLAGGQSNMRFPLSAAHDAAEALPEANDPQLRLFTVSLRAAERPLDTLAAKWTPCTPATAKDFSAVAYYFARELRRSLNCPVGVISASWGGTPIETWISLVGLQRSPPLERTLALWSKAVEEHARVVAQPQLAADYAAELVRWRREVEPAFNAATKAYNTAKEAGQPVGDKPVPAWPEPQNPDPMGMPSPSRRPQTPAISFNGMIAPLVPYALRGVIWYQGEANAQAGLEYRTLFPRLIQDWRQHWGYEFPFLFVQLPACYEDPVPVAEKGWPWLREAQAFALSEPQTGMAVTIDVGDPNNVHPTNKREVGRRLARVARHDVYGEAIVASGPIYAGCEINGRQVRVRFRSVGGGLVAGEAPWRARGVAPLPSDRLVGFFLAGEDRRWHPAEAVIDGDRVVVTCAAVAVPVAVRYGWANSPRCNLYNREGLPAAPFRSDDWPMPSTR